MRRPRVATPCTLTDLRLDEQNANKGTPRGRVHLGDSLKAYGAGRSILADRAGRVIAGNKTVEQARALGLPIRVVTTNGRELVVVQRTDLDLTTDRRARELALADNRIGELDLAWDPHVLQQLRAEGIDMGTWFTPEEWERLVGALTPDAAEDRVLEPGPTTIGRGDLFALGPHRLLCGDATDAADVRRLLAGATPGLMTTDPPYGVRYDPTWRHRVYPHHRNAVGRVANDDVAAWPEALRLFPGDVAYVWHAGKATATVAASLEAAGFIIRSQIIWHKQHFALSRSDYHWAHEPAFYAIRRGASSHWQGDRTQTTVWTVPNLNAMGGCRSGENAPTGHSTQKPVRLFEIPIRNHTVSGEAVYDPFVGSGTTIIAAEKLGRVAYAMDLDPQYVQVAITRWEALTGQKATALEHAATRQRRQV